MNFWRNLKKMFITKKCVICDDPISYEEKFPICNDCIEEWDKYVTMKCNTCGKNSDSCTCIPKDLKKIVPFACWSIFYTGKGQHIDSPDRIVFNLKESNAKDIYDFCANRIVKSIKTHCKIHNVNYKEFAVTYTPRSPDKIIEFGFDQSKELAKVIAKKLDIKFVTTLENNGSKEQKKLTKAERLENARKSYELIEDFQSVYDKLFIVDDVLTSGATLYHCTKLLLESGTKVVVPVTYCKDNIYKGEKENAKGNTKHNLTRIVKGIVRNGAQ